MKAKDTEAVSQHNASLWGKFSSYNLAMVTARFQEDFPQYAKIATELELECKRFLYATAIYPDSFLVPSDAIDEYWHTFILFTNEYNDFCTSTAGSFIHHYPPVGDTSYEKMFEQTKQVLGKLFGDFENSDLWESQDAARSRGKFCIHH